MTSQGECPHPLAGRTTRVLGVMLAMLLVPYAHPSMRRLRVVRAPWDKTEEQTGARVTASPTASVGEQQIKATENQATVTNALPSDPSRAPLDPAILAKTAGSLAVEDPTGHALDAFYARLAKTIRKEQGVTRVLHYGDSVIASDYVSGTMRRRMQQRFGDAGHGFILVANAWEWYFHNDVEHKASDGWTASRVTGPWTKDGFYGLGGVSFHTAKEATATFGTTARGDYGRSVSRYDVYYLEQPDGGDFQIEIKGQDPVRVSTRATDKASKKKSVTVGDGAAQMTLRTLGGGDVRMFGVVMERDTPGVAYDALGALGGRASLWGQQDGAHWKDQMGLRDPALIIVQYGTNESEDGGINEPQYQKAIGDLLDKLKAAAPDASILVAAPPDRAERTESGDLRTPKIIPRLIHFQHKVALEKGVAFWDTFKAMGGEGSMGHWLAKGLCSGDLTHPTPAGAQLLGDLMFKSLVTGYAAWASLHPEAPLLPEPDGGL